MAFEASLMVYKSGLIVYESTEQVEQVQRPEGPLQWYADPLYHNDGM